MLVAVASARVVTDVGRFVWQALFLCRPTIRSFNRRAAQRDGEERRGRRDGECAVIGCDAMRRAALHCMALQPATRSSRQPHRRLSASLPLSLCEQQPHPHIPMLTRARPALALARGVQQCAAMEVHRCTAGEGDHTHRGMDGERSGVTRIRGVSVTRWRTEPVIIFKWVWDAELFGAERGSTLAAVALACICSPPASRRCAAVICRCHLPLSSALSALPALRSSCLSAPATPLAVVLHRCMAQKQQFNRDKVGLDPTHSDGTEQNEFILCEIHVFSLEQSAQCACCI